ncbi:MAG: LD-carboxypeptidase, partial [Oscillospiraceae bacterium]|nr:LD-carboxypeptidase [Oscillospiraceae bacterium]
MLSLIKPVKLRPGDRVAAVSPSWGGAGDDELRWRYDYGVSRLENEFGLQVVPMPYTLEGSEYLYRNPKARADDLMKAFSDYTIKGIFVCIGGSDSIRLLPYLDFRMIGRNPKVLMGFSDTTAVHLMCMVAGITTFYGTSILCEFAENKEMQPYTVEAIKKALFDTAPIGEIRPAGIYASDYPQWADEAATKAAPRQFLPNTGFDLVQGCAPDREG